MIEATRFSIFARPPTLAAPEPEAPQLEMAEPAAPALQVADVEVPLPAPPSDDHPPVSVVFEESVAEPDVIESWLVAPAHPLPLAEGQAPSGAHPVVAEKTDMAATWAGALPGVAVAADQLGLAEPSAITLHVSLPESAPVHLRSQSGVYQPGAADFPEGEPQTGLARGTRILTARGEVAVEALLPGDMALGLRGPALLPIQRIGRAAVAKPGVQIEAGALGQNLPCRALRLAADHPVFLSPMAVPARHLVNGSTILAVALEGTELFQVDVGASDVLFAEGLPLSSDRRVSA